MKDLIGKMIILICGSLVSGSACRESEANVYTLYRNSVSDRNMRIHISTFDAKDGNDYNRENCELAKKLFLDQEGVKANFWCEKGYFK